MSHGKWNIRQFFHFLCAIHPSHSVVSNYQDHPVHVTVLTSNSLISSTASWKSSSSSSDVAVDFEAAAAADLSPALIPSADDGVAPTPDAESGTASEEFCEGVTQVIQRNT